MNINTKDDGAGGDHRRSVVQENWLVRSEHAYLKCHVFHELVLVITKQVQEPVHRFNWPGEIQVETELG